MNTGDLLGRYRLTRLITRDAGQSKDAGITSVAEVLLWEGYDTVLDRAVAIRVVDAEDARVPAIIGAAQASALVDDRRLLRVLDILDIPATSEYPAAVAVVSEWASGRNLERSIADRHGSPYGAAEAVAIVTEIARALVVAQQRRVAHGRLRPSSVFITDAGEVRLRGLAVDAAVFGIATASDGSEPTDPFASDLDSLGALLYLLSTATWPGAQPIDGAASPRQGTTVLLPSHVRASVPTSVDDLVARSLLAANRPKGVARLTDVSGFAATAGATENYLAPVASSGYAMPVQGWRRTAHTGLVVFRRVLAVAVAVALVVGIAWGGVQMLTSSGKDAKDAANPALADMLTEAAHPIDIAAGEAIEQLYPIAAMRSYDPFGDDDGNGKNDKRKGREGEEAVVTVNDTDPETAWVTDAYDSADLDGKGGTGLVIDLGSMKDIRQIDLRLVNAGGDLDVRAADRIMVDPALWTEVATIAHAPKKVTIRTPRPVNARYILIWLPSVPPAPDAGYGKYQQGIKSVTVKG